MSTVSLPRATLPPIPEYGAACLSSLLPALDSVLFGTPPDEQLNARSWLPEAVLGANQVVLLLLDGLGATQLERFADQLPVLSSMSGRAISSVAPTTTATALTSFTTGTVPAQHGILGYRMLVGDEVLNVLRWTTPAGDARSRIQPSELQREIPFFGRAVPTVTRSSFAGSGFTEAHQRGAVARGWSFPSSIAVEVAELLNHGEHLVYAYYDGIDHIAHEYGLGAHYLAELRAADSIVAEVLGVLPVGATLVVTADHGHVLDPCRSIELTDEVAADTLRCSGEGRFRWLHARAGRADALLEACRARFGDVAWVLGKDECIDAGLFGGRLADEFRPRIGDVALIASDLVAFSDPADTGEGRLISRHGSLTEAELSIPLVAAGR